MLSALNGLLMVVALMINKRPLSQTWRGLIPSIRKLLKKTVLTIVAEEKMAPLLTNAEEKVCTHNSDRRENGTISHYCGGKSMS
jgi:hypothetical protein